MGYLDKDGLSRAFTKLKTLIDKKQDGMKTVTIPSSSNTNKTKWIKFATIDLSSAIARDACSGTMSFTKTEGTSPEGDLRFEFRNGSTAGTITTTNLTWTSLSDSSYAGSVASVKVSNGKYDIYYKPLGDYESVRVSLVDVYNAGRFMFNVGSYVAGITAASTSSVKSYANIAGMANAVAWNNVSGKPASYTPSSHTHDDRYYTETEMDSKLSGKANSSHTHTKSQITDFPSSMKNPNSLTISLNGTSQGAYDGSAAKSINVTPSSIGAATSGHTHNYAGSSSAGGSATKADGIVVSDTREYNSAPNDAAFDKHRLTADFKSSSKIGSPAGFNGMYCGVLSFAPWSGSPGGHGYQLAFGYEKEGHPRLALRGSDLSATSWNSWYKVYTSDDKPTLSELGAAAANHTHTKSQITDFPSSMKNPNSLTISLNGTSQGAYDGSAAKSINVTPSSIGAATSGHTHNYAGSSSAGGSATKADGIVVSDTREYNSAPNDAAFDKHRLTADFKSSSKIGSPAGFNGMYCGVLSFAPWSGSPGGHGYQLAFGYEKEGHPRLALRGSDLSATSWNSWYKVYTSDDKPTLSELGAAAANHTHTKSQIIDLADITIGTAKPTSSTPGFFYIQTN